MILRILTCLLIVFGLSLQSTVAQVKLGSKSAISTSAPDVDYDKPKTYEIGGIEIKGVKFLDPNTIIQLSGLKVGDKIEVPGLGISSAIKKLWEQGFLGDIQIQIAKTETRPDGDYVFLDFVLREKPRLSKFQIKGLKKGDADNVREKISLIRGKSINDAIIKSTSNTIKKYFLEKGYYNTLVAITQEEDTAVTNSIILKINVTKGRKVKVSQLEIEGNVAFTDDEIRKKIKDTKQKNPWRIFKASRFIRSKFDADKQKLTEFYTKNGFRDVTIVGDSVWQNDDKTVGVRLTIEEGEKYYFGDITWAGNYLYKSDYLSTILNIRKGDVYNMDLLQKKLNYNPSGMDISSLYMDDGYLFYSIEPHEVAVNKDSINIELRMNEGAQARINKVTVEGNTKTNDHVILRELHTLPGQKFSRADLIRSNRDLATMGYFDPEKIGINPVPNPQDGTVDIHYSVEEKPSDQIELSGGWGGYYGFIGTLGLAFNNFSLRKMGKLREWAPLPSGDGQRFSIRFQANGKQFQTYSMSFTEPWFGGKRPNSLTVGINRSVQRSLSATNEVLSKLAINGVNFSLGKRLRWPDDYFTLLYSFNVQRYELFNYTGLIAGSTFGQGNTYSNSISFSTTLSRNSINNPTFPTTGSSFTMIMNITPPYSLFRKSNTYSSDNERFRWVEFNKWNFDASWFTPIAKNLVFNTRVHYGFIGSYNQKIGIGPFERFKLGGSGLSGFNFILGYDVIALRGYQTGLTTPVNGDAGIAFNKYVTELRYAISTNPAATIYVHGFLEGGNAWTSYKDYNPFNIYRSAGVGVRIQMPAFGILGVDYGRPFDIKPGMQADAFQFTIGQQIR